MEDKNKSDLYYSDFEKQTKKEKWSIEGLLVKTEILKTVAKGLILLNIERNQMAKILNDIADIIKQ